MPRKRSSKAKLIPGIPEDQYHADVTTLSASGAKVLLGKRPPAEDSAATAFGTLVHCAVLEPDKLDGYAVLDPAVLGLNKDGGPSANPTATAAWKEACKKARAGGKIVVQPDTMTRALAMRDAVHAHPAAAKLLAMATDYELSAYANHPSGARVRGRFDASWATGIVDIKTARDANPATFGKTCDQLGYHISAANYIDLGRACGMDVAAFAFISVETEPTPGGVYRVSVTELTVEAIALGRALMAEACERWLANGKTIDLPGYGDGFTTVDLPPWSYTNHRGLELSA